MSSALGHPSVLAARCDKSTFSGLSSASLGDGPTIQAFPSFPPTGAEVCKNRLSRTLLHPVPKCFGGIIHPEHTHKRVSVKRTNTIAANHPITHRTTKKLKDKGLINLVSEMGWTRFGSKSGFSRVGWVSSFQNARASGDGMS